jgi:hypothetical protein
MSSLRFFLLPGRGLHDQRRAFFWMLWNRVTAGSRGGAPLVAVFTAANARCQMLVYIGTPVQDSTVVADKGRPDPCSAFAV